MENNPVLFMHMENGTTIELTLDVYHNENSINGLLWMIFKQGYDHMKIARIVPDFVFQPWYDEAAMPEDYQYLMDGDFKKQHYQFKKYDIGLAGDGSDYSSPSCFFIVMGDDVSRLNGKFTYIGKVTAGFDELERIMALPLNKVDAGVEGVQIFQPTTDQYIKTITYNLHQYQYLPPKQFK